MDFAKFQLKSLINIAIYIGIGILFYLLVRYILRMIFKQHRTSSRLSEHQVQKIQTLKVMLTSVFKYVIIIGVFLAILSEFGVNVSSILAGAGIMAAVLGLALQDLTKDVIAGFTIIADGQYRVGDKIQVGDFTGTVVAVGLKSTRIRGPKGQIEIISNRNMDPIINYSMEEAPVKASGIPEKAGLAKTAPKGVK